MKAFAAALCVLWLIWVGATIYCGVCAKWAWQSEYQSHWNLADKSSTITAKSEHIDAFVKVIEDNRSGFARNNAILFRTPDNSFEGNFAALKTLAVRLREIKEMDPSSFQYNTAIEQITRQEQGEAGKMLEVIENCWWLGTHPFFWDTFLLIYVISIIACGIGCLYLGCVSYD